MLETRQLVDRPVDFDGLHHSALAPIDQPCGDADHVTHALDATGHHPSRVVFRCDHRHCLQGGEVRDHRAAKRQREHAVLGHTAHVGERADGHGVGPWHGRAHGLGLDPERFANAVADCRRHVFAEARQISEATVYFDRAHDPARVGIDEPRRDPHGFTKTLDTAADNPAGTVEGGYQRDGLDHGQSV